MPLILIFNTHDINLTPTLHEEAKYILKGFAI